MKICFCNTITSWGGGEKWHFEMATALSEYQHEIHFILRKGSEIDKKLNADINKKYFKVGGLSFLNPIKFWSLVRYFKQYQFDAIIINLPSELKLVARAAKYTGVKKVIYRRGSDVVVKNKPLNRYLLEKVTDIIIANSQSTKASLLKSGMNINDKIVVINNGIHPPKKEYCKVVNQVPVIGAVGRLMPEKGFDLLIDVADYLKKSGLEFVVKIAGEGDGRSLLEQLIKEKQLEDNVKLVGFINDIYDFFSSCDVFALTSRYEGFGYVMVEAMFSKLPVVAFDNSAAKEIVVHKETGLLSKSFDYRSFAENIIELFDAGCAQSYGLNGYKRAMSHYNFSLSTNKIINLINVQ